jgi:hypothetical protein
MKPRILSHDLLIKVGENSPGRCEQFLCVSTERREENSYFPYTLIIIAL